MKKSTVIATCLINSGFQLRIDEVEAAIAVTFSEEFPKLDYGKWNQEVDDRVAEGIIANVGRASMINVTKFIKDLGLPDE